MKTFFLSTLIVISLVFGFTSCGDDDNGGGPCSAAWASEVSDEINTLTAAAQAYGVSPSTTTCNAYKDAAQDYVDALESYRGSSTLTGTSRTDWENAIASAQASVDAISC